MNIAKAIVPVAGLGTRLLPTTKALPKEMLPVGRLPVVHHVVEELAAVGIRQILFITGRGKGAIEDYFDDSAMSYRERGIEFFSARQTPTPRHRHRGRRRGGLLAAGEPFVVAFGDSIVRTRSGQPLLQRMIDSHLHHCAAGTIGRVRSVRRANAPLRHLSPRSADSRRFQADRHPRKTNARANP